MGTVKGLAHIGVFVKELERSVAFYRDILGFSVTWKCVVGDGEEAVNVAFVKNGTCVLEIVECPSEAGRIDGPVDHIALDVDDIEALHLQLADKGIVFETEEVVFCDRVFPNGSKWILFRGPDGERLELNQVLPYV